MRRTLADARPKALESDFAAQLLHLRNLDEVKAEPAVCPVSTGTCWRRSGHGTAFFIGSTIDEDRSVLDLVGADYTYANERLARHYGVPAIAGAGSDARRHKAVDAGPSLGRVSTLG